MATIDPALEPVHAAQAGVPRVAGLIEQRRVGALQCRVNVARPVLSRVFLSVRQSGDTGRRIRLTFESVARIQARC